jgi:hypothetical protein
MKDREQATNSGSKGSSETALNNFCRDLLLEHCIHKRSISFFEIFNLSVIFKIYIRILTLNVYQSIGVCKDINLVFEKINFIMTSLFIELF